MRNILALLLCLIGMSLSAQRNFVHRLTTVETGKGVVRIYQSSTITSRVNGVAMVARADGAPHNVSGNSNTVTHSQDTEPTTNDTTIVTGNKVRVNGFRIQIYSGGNSRQSKQEAQSHGQRSRLYFPELPVYTGFVSPHWMCRVGDFRTREEALEVLTLMRQTGRFAEAVIVKSKVNVYY